MRTTLALTICLLAGCGAAETTPAPAPTPTPAPAAVAPTPELPPTLLVFMGDSITFRWATEDMVEGSINKGVPGDTPCQMLDRFKADVLDLHPARVHILGGANIISNDTPDATCIVTMATEAVAAGIVTYVGTVTPGYDRPQTGVEYFNAQLRVAAPVYGFTIVDYYPAMTTGPYFDQSLYVDTVHPSAAGYAIMERVFRAIVKP